MSIGKIRKLYRIEEQIGDIDPVQKQARRQALSKPVLDDLRAWLEKNQNRDPKDSLTRIAMAYMLNQWDLLVGYCDDGRLHISSGLADTINCFMVRWRRQGKRNLFQLGESGQSERTRAILVSETDIAGDRRR